MFLSVGFVATLDPNRTFYSNAGYSVYFMYQFKLDTNVL